MDPASSKRAETNRWRQWYDLRFVQDQWDLISFNDAGKHKIV